MKIVFFGTPDYVIPVLENLHKTFKTKEGSPILAVVTQPPRPSGRKKELEYSPVDTWGYKKHIQIIHNLNDTPQADLGVLASFGEIIPEETINKFTKGILNIHPSLLPNWRGASPVQASILSGEKQTGVSVILLTQKLDQGPIISSFKEEIKDTDTTKSLRDRLFKRSAEFICELIPNYMSGKIKPKQQDEKNATFTTIIKKENGFVPPKYIKNALNGKSLKEDWEIGFVKDFSINSTSENIHNFIRAMQPWPQAWTLINIDRKEEKRLKILESELDNDQLVLKRIQLEGKNPVTWKQFKEAYKDSFF